VKALVAGRDADARGRSFHSAGRHEIGAFAASSGRHEFGNPTGTPEVSGPGTGASRAQSTACPQARFSRQSERVGRRQSIGPSNGLQERRNTSIWLNGPSASWIRTACQVAVGETASPLRTDWFRGRPPGTILPPHRTLAVSRRLDVTGPRSDPLWVRAEGLGSTSQHLWPKGLGIAGPARPERSTLPPANYAAAKCHARLLGETGNFWATRLLLRLLFCIAARLCALRKRQKVRL